MNRNMLLSYPLGMLRLQSGLLNHAQASKQNCNSWIVRVQMG